MYKLANVVYTYSPKNDDELELTVGDKIEVIEPEEEGWWRGRLKGRIGVFPSNFVQVIETGSPNTTNNTQLLGSSPPIPPLTTTATVNNTPANNKLNLIGSKTSRNSLSSNSLNSNSSGNNNINNNNNLMMNNTQHQDNSGLAASGEVDPSNSSSERRPKPIRGIGYGDIFAASGGPPRLTKPRPVDSTSNLASERLSTSITTNPLQKQIPKKPPPPTPTTDNNSNGNSNEQAPALPPKPANNQFSPALLQHSRPPLPASLPQPPQQQQKQQVREQARVIYAYESQNHDELAMEVGDIINIIDKDIEDAGWWKGELRGKIGVFPDNFVQVIEVPELIGSGGQDWNQRIFDSSQPTTPNYNHQNTEGKLKSVFAATPKGFSKELENNLEKHNNNQASFLSLKRNKIQQQLSSAISGEPVMNVTDEDRKRDDVVSSSLENSATKLNHITANRAKGPSRRPPSNVLNKRNQLDQSKEESNGRDVPSLRSLPTNNLSSQHSTTHSHDTLSSLPSGQQQQQQHTSPPTVGLFATKPPNDGTPTNPIKPSLSLDNVIDSQTPKTSQRVAQPAMAVPDKPKTPATPLTTNATTTATTTNANTPSWMVQLKNAKAEKKRETPSLVNSSPEDETPVAKAPAAAAAVATPPALVAASAVPTDSSLSERKPTGLSNAQYDNLLKQISKTVTSEISGLREDVKRLQEDLKGVTELKGALEAMKIELKTCQSDTENQKRYIKELIANLADERKKIASMQVEIDRTLK